MPTFDTPQPIAISVEIGVGDLRIVASDRADTVVEVRPSDPAKPADVTAAEETSVEYARGVLRVRANGGLKRYGLRGGRASIEVRMEVPTGSRLRGHAGLAALRCAGVLGECHYKTGAGDITLEQVAGATDLATGTGAVRVDWIGGATTIKNSNGDVRIGQAEGHLQVRTANGEIEVDRSRASVTAKTANGHIRLGEVDRGVIVAETALGNVDVAVRSGVAAWLDLHTNFGQVRNLLELSRQPEPSQDALKVRARTHFGDVSIRRAYIGDNGQDAA